MWMPQYYRLQAFIRKNITCIKLYFVSHQDMIMPEDFYSEVDIEDKKSGKHECKDAKDGIHTLFL